MDWEVWEKSQTTTKMIGTTAVALWGWWIQETSKHWMSNSGYAQPFCPTSHMVSAHYVWGQIQLMEPNPVHGAGIVWPNLAAQGKGAWPHGVGRAWPSPNLAPQGDRAGNLQVGDCDIINATASPTRIFLTMGWIWRSGQGLSTSELEEGTLQLGSLLFSKRSCASKEMIYLYHTSCAKLECVISLLYNPEKLNWKLEGSHSGWWV